jgi:hypothetical protein
VKFIFLGKEGKGGDILPHKKQTNWCVPLSSIRVERRQRRRSQEEVKKKSFSLFLSLCRCLSSCSFLR